MCTKRKRVKQVLAKVIAGTKPSARYIVDIVRDMKINRMRLQYIRGRDVY